MSTNDINTNSHEPTLVTITNGEAVASSLAIAAGTETQHKNVLELIRSNLADFEAFGPLAFETRKGQPLPQGGFAKATEVALLTEPQATLLLTFMRNTEVVKRFKVALVKAFFELRERAAQQSAPTDPVEQMALGLMAAQKMLAAKDEQIAELAPAANSWNKLADAAGDFSVAEAAKILSRDPAIVTGRDRLFAYMESIGWIFKSRNPRGGWEAYQTQVDTGRVCERPAKPFLNSRTGNYELPAPTLRITAKGIQRLHVLLGGGPEGPNFMKAVAS